MGFIVRFFNLCYNFNGCDSMQVVIDGKVYDVIITYKNNKNMYLRVKDDLKIYITAPKRITKKEIEKFINSNIKQIEKMLQNEEEKKKRLNNKLLYLGNYYEIVYIENKKIIFTNDKVFVGKNFNINNFYKEEANKIFKEELDVCYNKFCEDIPYPSLKIRKMKSKWGVCNITKKIVTLNLDLIKLDKKYLDYVIIHELSHLIHPNHSKAFWVLVSKYEKNYKLYRKEMKNII